MLDGGLQMYPDAVVSLDAGDIGFGSGTGYKGLVFVVELRELMAAALARQA